MANQDNSEAGNQPASTAMLDASPVVEAVSSNSSYKLVWQGSPNFWSGRSGQKIQAICNHIMEGTLDSSNSWFKNRRSEVSAHFGVGKDGRIWQWVHTQDTAWANGILQSPDTHVDWLQQCVQKNINPNSCTLSIEHEGNSGVPFTEAQYQATLWLHHHLCTNYNIPADRDHIIGHYQITAHDRANCPGTAFPWERLLKDLASMDTSSSDNNKWTQGVSGVVLGDLGSFKIVVNNAYIRKRPSLSDKDGSFMSTLPRGKVVQCSAYTDAGPAYHGNPRWYLIADSSGGGWIHSTMLTPGQ